MEELRSSGARSRAGAALSRKIPNGSAAASSAYDDVFGGPPRYSGPFAARMGDYSEIFGGLASSCSIPVLDLPPALDGYEAPADARSSGFDYSEIFGCLDGGDFAVSYEELVAERERVEGEPKGQEAFSSNGRAPKETEFGQQVTEASETSPNGANRYVASLENDEISSNSTHSDDGSKQFNMSYHKTSHGNIVDALSENTHTTQLHAVPGFAFDVEARPPYSNIRSHNRPNMVTQDLSVDAGLNGGISDRKQGKMFSPSSAANSKCSGNNLETDQKQFFSDCPTSEYGPANLKIHSRSSSNHSTSSGDIYFPDATYLTISDISLRTQPLPVPPPSRLPPKLVNNHENPKMKICANSKADLGGGGLSKPMLDHQKHYDWVASRIQAPQESVRDSSCFFDVEVDASSAAAASAAAMKEAMEQAQARLKSAKESMERKRETLQSRKKLGQHEGTKHKAGKEDKTVQEVKIFSQVVTEKDLVKADKKSDFFSEEKEKVRRAAKVAPDREEKERHVVSDEQRQQAMQGNEFKSSQASILNEKSGEWKTDTQFYELVNNEKKFRPIKEVSDKICAEKMPKETTVVIKEKENGRTDVEVVYEFVSNGNSWEADEIREKNENATKSKAGNMACREEEIKELPNLISEACVQEQLVSQVEEIYGFHQQVKDEKLVEAQEAYIREEDVKKINAGEDVPACGENKKKLEFFDDDCKLEGHESEEKGSKLEAAKVVCGCEDSEEVTCQPHESEKKLKLANKTCTQDGNQKEIRVPHGVCMWEVGEKVEAAHEASQCENSERTRESAIVECCYEESKNKLKGTGLASEQEESKKPNRTEGLCMFVENESKHKVAQEGDELEENLEKLKAGGAIGRKENEKILVEEACRREYNERITRDGKLQGQQNDKKQTAAQVSFELENSKDLTVVELDHGKKENGNIKEVHVAIDLKEKHKMFNASREAFQMAVNRDLEDLREARLSEKKGNILSSAQHKTDFRTVVTGNTTDMRKKGERENERRIEREREQEKVLTRKLEEEKEREREREKDRLAVERATREAHERAFAEARERAERIAVERVTAEARQRALAESREKAERASAEALEKSLAEKASREARLRAERAAVERATAEARERAVERALAEKAAADARERAEKLSASSRDRMRKDNETEEQFRGRDKGDGGTRDFPHDAQFQSASSSSNGQRHSGEVESALRCKARLERHQRTFERAEKALAEKNLRDILAQREQSERNRLAETLDADVRRWSNGKEGNLRALLSTLQYILGPESGWQPIPLTDVITAAAAKKAYRKATLCVHPDKLQQRGASIQQKYVCEKVFDLLKEAWNRFNSEER